MTTQDKVTLKFFEANNANTQMLRRLLAAIENNDNAEPDDINWGTVATANHVQEQLREISDQLFNEGEHAA